MHESIANVVSLPTNGVGKVTSINVTKSSILPL